MLAHRRALLRGVHLRDDGGRDADRDFILQLEQVGSNPVVTLVPDLLAVAAVDQYHRKSDAVVGFTKAAVDNITHSQFGRDFRRAGFVVSELLRRGSRDDIEPEIVGQVGDEILGDCIDEELLRQVTAQIVERQHRDTGLA